MASKNIWVSVDLDDMDTDDLLDELENRYLGEREKNILMSILEDNDQKVKLFMAAKDRFTIYELENLLQEKCDTAIPKNHPTLF
jgi:hypothetical protein